MYSYKIYCSKNLRHLWTSNYLQQPNKIVDAETHQILEYTYDNLILSNTSGSSLIRIIKNSLNIFFILNDLRTLKLTKTLNLWNYARISSHHYYRNSRSAPHSFRVAPLILGFRRALLDKTEFCTERSLWAFLILLILIPHLLSALLSVLGFMSLTCKQVNSNRYYRKNNQTLGNVVQK